MRRTLIAIYALTALLASCVVNANAQTYSTYSHVLVSQRPDSQGAVRCNPLPTFEAGCASFTSSTVNLMMPTRDPLWVQFRVEMVAFSEDDAVRLRAFRWVVKNGTWTQEDTYFPAAKPNVLGAPRTVGYYLDPFWWSSLQGEWTFVLEFKGSPRIHGAQIIRVERDR